MNYIVCKKKQENYFKKIGDYNFCRIEDLILTDVLAVDTETTGLVARHNDIFCIQIGTGKNNYIIVLYDNNYNFEDCIPYLNNRTLIFHNATFDLGFFYKNNFYPKNVKDTMIASKIIYNGDIENQRNDFGTCMKRELDVFYDKTNQRNIHLIKLSQASTIEYSFNDVDRLIDLHDVLLEKITDNDQNKTYDLHCRYVKALAYMEQSGMPLSSEKWDEKIKTDNNNTIINKKEVEEYIYDKIKRFADSQIDMFEEKKRILVSTTSPKQMIKVFKELKVNIIDKDGKESINEKIISKSDHEFVKIWLKYQNSNHRVSTFGETIYNKIENERIYTNFNPMVDTARLSSRRGAINFLNFPNDKETRSCFSTGNDTKLIVCDFSAQEGVIMADFSKDEAMTSSVVNGVDLHCLLAKAIFPELNGLSDEEISTTHKDKRSFAKSPRFAFSYGGNGYTVHQNSGLPLKECERIYDVFRELHSGLYSWGDNVYNESIKTGYIVSVDGWRLKLPKYNLFLKLKNIIEAIPKEKWQMYKQGKNESIRQKLCLENKKEFKFIYKDSYNYYKSKKKDVSSFFKIKSEYGRLCLNSPVQTCGAHQIKLSTVLLFEWIIDNNYQNQILICNSIHDELVVEPINSLAELTKKKVEEFMKIGGNSYLNDLVLNAEAAIGQNWYEAK